MTATGEPLTPLDEADVHAAVEHFRQHGVDSVAVAFMNAYANPAHEIAAMVALRKFGFDGEISLSHQASREYREYERTSTTAIDAYVRPVMRRYLGALTSRLEEGGFTGVGLITRSGGGSLTFPEAAGRPFETIMSGPVAGADAAAKLARELDLKTVITADVGGTTFDTCLIDGGQPPLLYEGAVEGMPVQAPWMDVRSIGAGGGSVAEVDVGGLLKVGPASAGAVPGPACYGRGGTLPTVSDAALLLGMLGTGHLASGLVLDHEKAAMALQPLATRLDYTVAETAQGIMTIAASSMASTIRAICFERGHDPREAALMAFGGAGPLFGTLLARALDISQVIVPPLAGNFSAWGLLSADQVRTAAQTRIMALDESAIAEANGLLAHLFESLSTSDHITDTVVAEVGVDLRYVGQEHSLTIRLPGDQITADVEQLVAMFVAEYKRTFDHELNEAVQVVAVRASLRTQLPAMHIKPEPPAATPDTRSAESQPAWSFSRAQELPFSLLRREQVTEEGIEGPAIIVEDTATTYLDCDFAARSDPQGVLHLIDMKGA